MNSERVIKPPAAAAFPALQGLDVVMHRGLLLPICSACHFRITQREREREREKERKRGITVLSGTAYPTSLPVHTYLYVR